MSRSAAPSGWLLRWDTVHGGGPRAIQPEDAQARRAQVFEAESEGFVVFDGYLFDRAELGLDVSASDPAMLARAYDRWGGGLFDKLRGGFAAAIWDPQQQRLLVGRDAMGLVPCFYWWNERVFLMSSSVDAILSQPEVDGRFNRVVLAEYLQNWSPPGQVRETFFEGIQRLPPAHTLSLRRGRLAVSRYWDPVPPGFAWASEGELSCFTPVLDRAVRRCLSVGADSLALSGGFDSVSIAALAFEARRGKAPLHALSLRFTHPTCDEGETQKGVAHALGMPQLMRSLEESLDGDGLAGALLTQSRTSPSPVLSPWQPMYSGLLRSAGRLGLRSVLMGTGGDELFYVEPTYGADRLAALDLRGLWRFYRACQRTSPNGAAHVARVVLWDEAAKPELRQLARMSLEWISPGVMNWIAGRRRARARSHWLAPPDHGLMAALEDRRATAMPVELAPGERAYARSIRSLTQAPHLARELDQAHAWAGHLGFTILFPYFDRDLVELSLRMHPEQLIAGGRTKAPLRRLVADRLPSISSRATKVDFGRMFHELFRPSGRQAWKALGGPVMLGELGIVDPHRVSRGVASYFDGNDSHGYRSWLVLSTEMWLRAGAGGSFTPENRRLWDGAG